jgi:hypothetical protein
LRRVARTTVIAILISSAIVAATALSGCWVTGTGRARSPVWVPASGRPMPSGFSDVRAWSAKVTWSRTALVNAGVPATPELASQYVSPPAFGLVAVAGDVVVMATFTTRHTDAPTPVTLQFHNAKTGEMLASKSLETWQFVGIRADTLGGKAVVEVRYSPVPTRGDNSTFVSTVFDTSAHRLWTSADQKVTAFPTTGGLWLLPTTGGLLSHGFLVRVNPGDGEWNAGASYDVIDTTGKIVMNVPYHGFFNPANPTKENTINAVQLIDGYAVVSHGDTDPAGFSPPAQARFRFIVYDLAHGGKKVAEAHESVLVVPSNVYNSPRAVAACGSKIVLSWETGSMNRPSDTAIRIAVLDIRTGQTTPPVAVATPLRSYPPILYALSDPTCSTMLIYGGIPGTAPTFAINLAHGTLLWRKDHQDRYLSVHNGVVYALQAQSQPAPRGYRFPTPLPGRLLSIAPDGSTSSSDLAVAPLAFAAGGSPVFAEMSEPAVCEPQPPSPTASSPSRAASRPSPLPTRPASCDITVWVGRASR